MTNYSSLGTILSLDNDGGTGAITGAGGRRTTLPSPWPTGAALVIEGKTVNGQGGTPTSPGTSKKYRIYFAFSYDLVDEADCAGVLVNSADYVDLNLPNSAASDANGTRYKLSLPTLISGPYLYTWYDRDAFASNALCDVIVNAYVICL